MNQLRNNSVGLRGVAGSVAAGVGAAVMALSLASAPAAAQGGSRVMSGSQAGSSVRPERETLLKMTRLVSIDITEQRLEDVIKFLQELTGADIEPAWRDEQNDGLDREQLITVSVKNAPAMTLLERVLTKAQTNFTQNTWQLDESGTLEIGSKDRLNKNKRLVIYSIHDLLTEVPNYYDAPQIDLQGVLQQSQGGGGGGQSPFRDDQQNQQNQQEAEQRRQERVDQIMDLLRTFVEPEQWVDNGGDGGTMRYFQGSLIINAPDYMHRQIVGYSYWPQRRVSTVKGRRYVTLNMDVGNAQVDRIENFPVRAVTGGSGGAGGPGPGGG